MKRSRYIAALALAFLLAICAWAQAPAPPTQVPVQQPKIPVRVPSGEQGPQARQAQQPGMSGEGLLEDYEQHEQEEHAEFKYSKSVRWIARTSGLSIGAAYWVSLGVNFAIIAGAVFWFWRKYTPAAFRARTASIQKGMEEARRASEDANRRLAEVETRLARIDSEIASLRATAENEAAAEEARLHAAAEHDKTRIIEAARQEIEAATRHAQRDLRAYAAGLAVSLAEKRIQVDPAADRALFHSFVEQLANGERS